MFNLGPFELVAIFVVALLVFGPEKLPEMGKQVGKAIREFRKFQESMQGQVRDVLEPISGPIIPNGSIVGPQPTNIKGVIPTELPEGQKPFGYYAPVDAPSRETETAAPAPGGATQAGETPPPNDPAGPESR
jgi:TatA/E family protein of Tat protein translocase